MNKNDLINDIVSRCSTFLDPEQIQMLKATMIVSMYNLDIHEVCTLPSTEVKSNQYILQRFVIDMTAKGLKASTIKNYLTLIKPFFDEVNKNYRDVTSDDIKNYLAKKKITTNNFGKMNSNTYISNINRVMFVFWQWAYKKHHIDTDIMLDVDRMKSKQKKKERLSIEEVEACRDHVQDDRERAFLELMLSTGMRVGEIAKLRIEHIDFAKRKIYIPDGKSDSAERYVYLTVKAKNAMMKYIGGRKTGFAFRPDKKSDESKPLCNGTINGWAKDIGKRAECHCVTTVHVYRKTFATEEYRRTGNIKYVSILLGHSSTAVTEKFYLVDDIKDIEYQALYAA